MKILLVSDVSIHKVIGGAERVLYEQAVRLRQRGHAVHVLTRKLPEHENKTETILDVCEWRYSVDYCTPWSFLHSTLHNGRHLFESLQREFRFDCLVFHQPFSACAVVGSKASQAVPKVYICHSLAFEEYISRNPVTGGLLHRIAHAGNTLARKYIERRALRSSEMILVLSRFTREKLWNAHRIASERVRIIPGGVDIDRFYPIPDRSAIRERLGLPREKIILFTVRNLVARMGLENLIRAVQAIAAHFPEVHLVIGGKGPLRESLAAPARELGIEAHVHFAGFIPESDLPDYYRMADLFILPTLELEGFGLVTVEALACGTPVLGTPVGGTLEILKDLNPDFLFGGTTAEAIAERVISVCRRIKTEPCFREMQSLLCRQFVEARYSWERNVIDTEAALAEVVSGGNA